MNLREIVPRFFSVGAMRVATALLSLLLFWYVARVRGTHELGELSLLLGIFYFFQLTTLLGLNLIIVRDIAADPASAPRHVANGCLLGLGVAVPLALAVGVAGSHLYAEFLAVPLWIMAAALVPTAIITVAESLLIARQRMHLYGAVIVAETLLRVVASLVVLQLGYGLAALMLVFLCGRLLAVACYLWKGDLLATAARGRIERDTLRYYLRTAPVVLGILLLTVTLARFDVFFLSLMAPLSDVGLYSAAYKIYEVALMAPSIITVVLYPAFAAAHRKDPERFDALVSQCLKLLALAGTPCALAVGFFARPLLELAFGAPFAAATPVLQLLIGCTVLTALDQVFAMTLLVHGRQDLDLLVLAVAAAFFVAALALLIPLFGFVGAALATLLATTARLAVRFHLVRTRLGFPRLASAL